ncbi:NTF2-related export protein [Neodiprion pinetum]|uniref:NTF2-related export protein n=1 Tax=Neodiprion lecontei TaxID=441921 RepID=A0A6J0C1S6_NEOLC|nr:NTF2-related export protein [Neodiprion lecontei]XP_046409881.1 NTF2-related export protein [Neodiprion fabricii]XP_046467521.1 NTF2-related export protein [Neodiprion pinetum]XP_046605273.1 NTF2-related export protein [Neodiprion virginianus]
MEQDIKSKIDEACRTAEEFTKLYYKAIDKQRYMISKLYLDTGILIWNGNGIVAKDQIQKFWMDLPASDHSTTTLDAQPVTGAAVGNQPTFLIKVSGQVKFQDKPSKPFNQNFLITAVGDKWKIVSDCFRVQEALDSTT